MEVARVATAFVPEVWDEVAPLLGKALAQTYGEFSLADILDAIMDERSQLHVIGDQEHGLVAAAVTEVVQYPQRLALRIHLLGGELLNGWRVAFEAHLEQGARNIGADQLEFIGRPGWTRVFRSDHDKRTVREVVIRDLH